MFDAIKNYLALANGLTEVTRQRALSAAKALVSSGEATAEQVTNLADDLLTTSRNNRDTVLALIRYEIDRALVRLGLATSEEVAALVQRLESLEATVKDAAPGGPPAAAEPPAGSPARPTKRATKAARKAPAKRSPAKRAPAKRVAGGTSPGVASSDASPRESDNSPKADVAPSVPKAADPTPPPAPASTPDSTPDSVIDSTPDATGDAS